MAKIRSIKPAFARHEKLQDLESGHVELRPMLTFSCLWMVCDREGRFEWNPKQLKLDILPFVQYDLGAALELLRSNGFIVLYEISGKRYGYIPTWHDHQHINIKESKSVIPPPHLPLVRQLPDASGEHPVCSPNDSPTTNGSLPSGSGGGSGIGIGNGSGGGRRVAQEPAPQDPEQDAKDLPPIALAQKVAHELCLNQKYVIEAIAGAIEFCQKFENRTPNGAVEFLIAESKKALSSGQTVNPFWFNDRLWRPKDANRARAPSPVSTDSEAILAAKRAKRQSAMGENS